MGRRMTYLRRFRCPICGLSMTFPKNRGTEKGHIKTTYCPICKKDVDFIQEDMEHV